MARCENPYSHLTAKDRDRPSFPTRKLLGLGQIQGRVLDYGCGHGADVEFLRDKGFKVEGYDPHYAPEHPNGTFDTVLCHYVLNVLMQRAQTEVLMNVSEYLRPSGTAFYTVRRDLRRTGFRQHYKHGVPTYQTNVRLPYETAVHTKFCEIYRYQPYPQRTRGVECGLCNPDSKTALVSESALAVAVAAPTPTADGHTLILPKRHVEDYFDLAKREQKACCLLVNRAHALLADRLDPDTVTVGLNLEGMTSPAADHAHLHVIPR